MSFFRSLFLLCIGSLLAAALLSLLASALGKDTSSGGYAVLSTVDTLNDRNIRALLDEGKDNFAGAAVSESSQWVALDEFGSLETVPLDKYSARLNSFDPRNDGYAAKLKNLFTRDGMRFFFIPLKSSNSVPAKLDRQFAQLLSGVSFSVEYLGIGKPYPFFFIIYAVSCAALLLLFFFKKKLNAGFWAVVSLLPVLCALAFFGAPGIACAALFLGLLLMLREPFNELAILLRSKEVSKKFDLIVKNAVEPYRIYWMFLPVFALSFALIAIFSELKILFLLAVFAAAAAVFFLSVKTSYLFGGKHTRFTPVQILRRRFVDFSFCTYMLPFIAAALLVILISPYVSGVPVSQNKIETLVEEKDYYAHLAFQSSFSTRQLGESSGYYPNFIIGEDGLPSIDAKHASSANINVNIEHFPPFPLKHLMDFFNSVNNGSKIGRGAGSGRAVENISLLVMLIFIFPGFFLNGKISFPNKGSFSGFKRFTGKIFSNKLRWTDKTRNKVLLYNSANTLQLRKDA